MPPAECHQKGTAATGVALAGPGDAELFHLFLKRRAFHPESSCGSLRTAHDPDRFPEGADDLLSFGVGQGNGRAGWWRGGLRIQRRQIAEGDVK